MESSFLLKNIVKKISKPLDFRYIRVYNKSEMNVFIKRSGYA